MFAARRIIRLFALPAAMAAFILAAQLSGGLVLRTAVGPVQFANLR
ncbi:hypothetical protein [Tardiphaga sp.]|nr:hypothetical protein [Tardiphaga sp.]MDB5617403.1 hypothetical protein [Tardiphaga sp.]